MGVSYGYFGDLMTHSEEYRWLGRSRYTISGIRTFLGHRSYKGIIRYSAEDSDQDGLLVDRCGEGCPTCSRSLERSNQKGDDVQNATSSSNVSREDSLHITK